MAGLEESCDFGLPLEMRELNKDELVRLADPDGNGWVTLDEFVNMPCWQLPPLPTHSPHEDQRASWRLSRLLPLARRRAPPPPAPPWQR